MVWLFYLSPIPWLQLKIGQLKGSMKQCQCRRLHFPKIFGLWTTFNSRFNMQHPRTRSWSLVTSIQLEPNFQCSTGGEAGWTFRQQGRLWVSVAPYSIKHQMMFCQPKNQSHQIVIHILRCKHCSFFFKGCCQMLSLPTDSSGLWRQVSFISIWYKYLLSLAT